MIFLGKIKDGKLEMDAPVAFKRYLATLDGRITVNVEDYIAKRTLSQNSFYWFFLTLIGNETGNNPTELNEYFKRVLLPPRFITVLGKEIKIPQSTTRLNKIEFGEYLDKICALTEVPLPDPNLINSWVKN